MVCWVGDCVIVGYYFCSGRVEMDKRNEGDEGDLNWDFDYGEYDVR